MTKEEYQKITQAFQQFLRFLAQTHHDESWHDTRRQFLAHADQQIAALVDVPEEPVPVDVLPSEEAVKPEPEVKPGRPGNNHTQPTTS